MTTNERQKKFREARRKAGYKRVQVWVPEWVSPILLKNAAIDLEHALKLMAEKMNLFR